MKNITLRQLRIFAAVAKHLSFVRASEELALTAPAISMQIKDLEEEVGLPLFDRSSRSVSLTRVGKDVLTHALRVLTATRDMQDLVANIRGLKGGVLDVAMVDTASYFVPRLIALFSRPHPDVEIRLQVASNRESIARMLGQGEVELAIMGQPSDDWRTEAVAFAPNPQVLVTAIDHRFVRMQHVPPEALASEAFIMREPLSGTRSTLEEYLHAHRLAARSIMQMSSNEAIKQAVIAGIGISLLPLHTVGLELAHGLMAVPTVDGLPVIRRWHLVHSTGKVLSPAASAFRHFILEQGAELLTRSFPAMRAEQPVSDRR